MSMSTRVVAFRAPDEKWRQMKAVWDSCKAVSINPPREVQDFFGDAWLDEREPDPAGLEIPLSAREWYSDNGSGVEIDIADLPADITTIRFYNSW